VKTDIHLWSYLTQYKFECEMFQMKLVEKIKTDVLCLITLFWKSGHLWDNVERHCGAGQAKDDNMGCISKAINTCSDYMIHIALQLQQWLHEHVSMLTLYVHWWYCYYCLCHAHVCICIMHVLIFVPPVTLIWTMCVCAINCSSKLNMSSVRL
jgi:hypothetical protein